MSIRAYRLNSINFEQSESFNLSHDISLMDILVKEDFFEKLNMDSSGISEVPVSILKKALKDKGISKDIKNSLKVDIRWAKDNDKEYIQYYCF